MDEFLALLGFWLAAIVGIAAGIFILMVAWAAVPGPLSCTALAEGMKVKTEYRFWYGCFVTMPDGQILPESIARDVMSHKYGIEIKQR